MNCNSKQYSVRWLTSSLVLTLLILVPQIAFAAAVECPARQTDHLLIDYNHDECRSVVLTDYQTSLSAVWLQIPLEVSAQHRDGKEPLGLFISGNMSLRAYINGHYIGEKGTPALHRDNETVGPFDWVGYIDKRILESQNNTLSLFLSGHSNILHKEMFFNRLYVDVYDSTTQSYARHYAPTLVTLGVLLISLLFILKQHRAKARGAKFSKMLLFLVTLAMLQLILEVARGFIAYSYPVHDLRLHAILLCSFLFGQLLLRYLLKLTDTKGQKTIVICSALFTLLAVFVVNDLDTKAILAFSVPAIFGLIALCFNLIQENYSASRLKAARLASVFLITFILLTFLRGAFLDHYFFGCVSLMLFFITIMEPESKLKSSQTRNEEQPIDNEMPSTVPVKMADEDKPVLKIKSAREMLIIKVAQIAYCKAAGDYVELVCDDKTQLYSGSLRQLMHELPGNFLKVHRSYVVNTGRICGIKRHPSGNGELSLDNGDSVPVSRTLFLQTKEALA